MLVRELMSSPVVTIADDATLEDAVERLLARDVGSVVLVEPGGGDDGSGEAPPAPAGILTTSDVLRAAHERGAPLAAIPVAPAASSPLVTVSPDRTVGHAIDRMDGEDVRHLPVVDGFDVVGIVTITDVAAAYDDVRDEAMDLVGERRTWESGG